jgi:hypothetical protein
MTTIIDGLAKLSPYIGTFCSNIERLVKESAAEKAESLKMFTGAANEIYGNHAILEKINPAVVKTHAINSPLMKGILNDLQTSYTEKCIAYIKKFPQIKRKDKKNFTGKLSLALHKINTLRFFASKTSEELETYKGFRPAVRLQNIGKIYKDIIKILSAYPEIRLNR